MPDASEASYGDPSQLFADDSRGATLSDDGMYRYSLWRAWGPGPRLGLVMINPSSADALVDDKTIVRCCGFAARESFDGIEVANLYAYRTPYPNALWQARREGTDIVGLENDAAVRRLLADCECVVAAWGAVSRLAADRIVAVENMAKRCKRTLHCLGFTENGEPRHPLMLAKDTPLEVYR